MTKSLFALALVLGRMALIVVQVRGLLYTRFDSSQAIIDWIHIAWRDFRWFLRLTYNPALH